LFASLKGDDKLNTEIRDILRYTSSLHILHCNHTLHAARQKLLAKTYIIKLSFTSPWRWRQYGPLKDFYPTTTLHGVTTQKTCKFSALIIKESPHDNMAGHGLHLMPRYTSIRNVFRIHMSWPSANFCRPTAELLMPEPRLYSEEGTMWAAGVLQMVNKVIGTTQILIPS